MDGKAADHIGLSAHLLSRQASYRSAGIHSYILNLIRRLPAVDAHLRFTVFAGHKRGNSFAASNRLHWQISRWPTENPWVRVLWEQGVQPWTAHRAGLQLLHALAFVSPLVAGVPTVVTVHDLSFLRFPERFRPANRLYLSTMTRLSCRRARRIIAVSQATADECTQLLGVPPQKIDVIPHGVDHKRFCPQSAERVMRFRREKDLPDRFVLFLGTLEPRKNLTMLIEAFARTDAVRRGVKLVIAGGKGWYYHQVFERVVAVGLTDAVDFPGFVPDADLPLWYNAATVFVYPSIYEGFGMPLLEAMACGTPVVSSDASCMPEVVGEAGLLISPDDVDGLADAMDRLLTDADLHADSSRRGLARAAAYTWSMTAQATVSSYRRALERGG
jgi:glycosyltransferase involved in cell wall biosynthesis